MRVRNPDGHMTLMSDAIDIMKVTANRLGPGTNDEIKAFGNYVVSKMNSFSTDTRKVVEHAIIDILMKADKGFFGQTHSSILPQFHPTITQPSTSFQSSQFTYPNSQYICQHPPEHSHHSSSIPHEPEMQQQQIYSTLSQASPQQTVTSPQSDQSNLSDINDYT